MYDISKEYIERLLKESGVKLGGAKACAITTLVEMLDANSLDGLLASIRADYDAMKTATKNLDYLKQQEEYYKGLVSSSYRQFKQLETQIEQAKKRIEALKEEERTAQLEADLRGCLDEERSRLVAYEAAIRIGKAAYGDRIPSDAMQQILRSASNVAAGFVPMTKKQTEDCAEAAPAPRQSRRNRPI